MHANKIYIKMPRFMVILFFENELEKCILMMRCLPVCYKQESIYYAWSEDDHMHPPHLCSSAFLKSI